MEKIAKVLLVLMLTVALVLGTVTTAKACTGLLIGSDLTEDGSTIITRTEDLEVNHNKIYLIHEAGKYKKGDVIKDVSYDEEKGYEFVMPHDSFRYTSVSDTTPEYGIFDEAGFNDQGLIADMTVSASCHEKVQEVDPYLDGSDESKPIGFSEGVITTVVLSTASTSREGIQLVANEVATKGTAEGNAFVLADKDEVWYMEIYSGHQFLAMKYPKDKFSVFPNSFWINEVTLEKGEESDNYITSKDDNYIYSKGIFETAKKAGTLVGDEEKGVIDLFASYSEETLSDSNKSRACSGILSINPDAKVSMDSQTYDFLQDAPQRKLTVKDAMNFTRNRLENITEEEANDRGRDSLYPIGNRNTMESHIFQIPANASKDEPGVMWLTLGSPLVQPYVPYYPNQTAAIPEVQNPTNDPEPGKSHYWTVMDILHMVETNRKDMMEIIRPEVEKLENELIAKTDVAAKGDRTEENKKDAQQAFDLLKDLHGKVQVKYDEFLKDQDYTSVFYGRRKTADFTTMSIAVPKGTADTYLNLSVSPEDEKSGKIEIVDNYGNPVEKLANEVLFSLPKSAFADKPEIKAGDQAVELKEDGDKYTFSTDQTAFTYAVAGEEAPAETSEAPAEASSAAPAESSSSSGVPTWLIGLIVLGAVVGGYAAYKNSKKKK
ncbi:dipeptidase [Kallipyga massiliensis]|uniref:dipeptidase n=1 Tax=Kallipyga massiliensis TaxID=1472764 RepID=UPI0026EE3892|nr:C69 family dipeptidase [Kallipyga massiliensis]